MSKFMRFLGSILVVLLIAVVILLLVKDKIIFKPDSATTIQAELSAHHPELELRLPDRPVFRGYAIATEDSRIKQKNGYLKYFIFGDTDADVLRMMPSAVEKFPLGNVISLNYRGFGRSGGAASSSKLMDDMVALHELFATGDHPRPTEVLIGYGLGANVAVRLARTYAPYVRGVVVISPAVDLHSVLAKRLGVSKIPSFVPNRFDVRDDLQFVTPRIPLLCIASEADEKIPFELSVDFCSQWPGEVYSMTLPDTPHAFMWNAQVVQTISQFLAELSVE